MKKLFLISSILLTAVILFSFLYLTDQIKTISPQTVAEAEKILGLEFTPAERDSMIDVLNEQRYNYEEIRNYNLSNDIPPSIQFNPLPVGFKFDEKKKEFIAGNYSSTQMPESIDDLAFYSIGELAHLLKTEQITSAELTKFYLERLKKYGPVLESVITLTEDLALKQAAKADEEISAGNYKGLLHGIPYGAKDLLAVKNYKTTWGAEPYKEQMIDENAAVIQKLEEAGAILTAKLTMGALAWGDVWFDGKTRNPWDTTQGSSGSSAGSAASVSAGLLPFAIGTETYGSIVSPSTVTGITGLRPTYGRVSRAGAMALSWTMDKIGPICRNAEDCAIVLNAIAGPDGKDQSVYDFPFNYNPNLDIKKLRIGYLKDDFDSTYDFKKNDSLALETFGKNGIRLIPVKLPKHNIYDISIMLSAEAAAAFDDLTRSGKDDLLVRQIKNAWPNVFRAARFIPAVEYINASRIRYLLIQDMAKLMDSVDVIIAPSWNGDNLLLTNLTGHPAIVVPNGFSEEGTPTSISFIGGLFEEGEIIAVGKAFQEMTEFHRKHPELR